MTTNYIQSKVILPEILKFDCPSDAKAVNLDTIYDHLYDLMSIPRCVEHIQFSHKFNQKIKKGELPEGLQSIVFGCDFNQEIEKDVLPVKLQSIRFGANFDQKIEKNVLPAGLQSIVFGRDFNQEIDKNVLPDGLQSISFDEEFNQTIEKDILPAGLQSIKFSDLFNQPIEKDVLPAGLQSIIFGGSFNQPIDNILDTVKVYLFNIPSKITRSYTLYQYNKSRLEKLIDNKKVGEIYESKIDNCTCYMMDVEITKPEINKKKIMELINQIKVELQI